MALDLNDPELEFGDLVTAYQSWVMAVINDEKLGGDPLLTEDITDDALNAMRFLPDVVTSVMVCSLPVCRFPLERVAAGPLACAWAACPRP